MNKDCSLSDHCNDYGNRADHKVKIYKIQVNLEPFLNLDSYILSDETASTQTCSERIKILKENLRLEHLNLEE